MLRAFLLSCVLGALLVASGLKILRIRQWNEFVTEPTLLTLPLMTMAEAEAHRRTLLVLATVGKTGKVDIPQLHFEIRKARRPIDPRSLIS